MNSLRFYVVCPPHTPSFGMGDPLSAGEYLQNVRAHAQWADRHGITGMVLYSFPASLDPWAGASVVLNCTEQLRPIVTVMPFQIHPYVLVRAVASLSYLHQRGIDLNIVAGASPGELTSLGQSTNSKQNYARLREYVTIVKQLLGGEASLRGDYYQVSQAQVPLAIDPLHRPEIFIPGSSEFTAPVVRDLADSSLLTAKPLSVLRDELARISGDKADVTHTIIVGLVARPHADDAWAHAARRQPTDRRSRIVSRLFAAKTSSGQHRQNVALADQRELYDQNLWYGAAKIGIDCPKLVGSYDEVRAGISAYAEAGVSNFLIDLPDNLEEYNHIFEVIRPLLKAANNTA